MDKREIFAAVIEQLEGKLNVLVNSAYEAKEASTNEESKAENKYDTRGLEASYLAAGQAKRAQELQELIYNTKKVHLKDFTHDDSISVSALVEVDLNEEERKWFFVLPVGGEELDFKGQLIQTITIDSPLGKKLFGGFAGDDFKLGKNSYEILRVK